MCFFIQLLLSMFWSMAMVTYPILSLVMLWSIWMIDQCWFSINHNVFFYSIIFPLINTIDMIIQCQLQHQSLINGTMYASFIELFLSMFDECYFVPNEKKLCVSIFVDCKAYANYARWIEIWETRNWTHTHIHI
jgi:hypothetical protein